jgi:hypothetical protein
MSKAGGKKEREMANAAHELFLLGQKLLKRAPYWQHCKNS